MPIDIHLNTTQDIGHGVTVVFICFIVVGVAVLLDLYTGIKAAKMTGEPVRSHVLRRTITKIIEYWLTVVFGVLIDVLGLTFAWYKLPYAAILVAFAALIIEGRSLFENLQRAKSPAAKVDDVAGDLLQEIIDAKSSKTAIKVLEKIRKEAKDEQK